MPGPRGVSGVGSALGPYHAWMWCRKRFRKGEDPGCEPSGCNLTIEGVRADEVAHGVGKQGDDLVDDHVGEEEEASEEEATRDAGEHGDAGAAE